MFLYFSYIISYKVYQPYQTQHRNYKRTFSMKTFSDQKRDFGGLILFFIILIFLLTYSFLKSLEHLFYTCFEFHCFIFISKIKSDSSILHIIKINNDKWIPSVYHYKTSGMQFSLSFIANHDVTSNMN